MRARRSGSSAKPCGGSTGVLADPRTAGLAGEAERTLAEARGAAERVNRILREVEEGRGPSTRSSTTRGRMLKDLEGVLARAGTLVAGVERGEARSACSSGIQTRPGRSAGL